MERTRHIPDSGNRHVQRKYSNGSPELRRTGSKDQSYFDSKSPKGREALEREKHTRPNFGEYRETAVFSEDGHSPLGNISCPQIHSDTDEAVLDRSPPLQTESHRVPYFRYFGPTAIVPGFKQMVVSVREHRRSTGAGSSVASTFHECSLSILVTDKGSVSWLRWLWGTHAFSSWNRAKVLH
jgi:hypothetical protein